jgi:hypothetical protein
MKRDKLDKLAGASPELQKGLATAAKIQDMLADGKRRCDDLRKQMEELEREDLVAQQRFLAQQRFFQGAPTNGAHHGLEAFNKLMKG